MLRILRSRSRSLSFLLHELFPEYTFGHVLIVRTAPKPDAFDGCFATACDGVGVIELEMGTCGASLPGIVHERALSPVALPDRALHVGRNVSRIL